jgi:hypothetical protein
LDSWPWARSGPAAVRCAGEGSGAAGGMS